MNRYIIVNINLDDEEKEKLGVDILENYGLNWIPIMAFGSLVFEEWAGNQLVFWILYHIIGWNPIPQVGVNCPFHTCAPGQM